jgi:hypothetical protein
MYMSQLWRCLLSHETSDLCSILFAIITRTETPAKPLSRLVTGAYIWQLLIPVRYGGVYISFIPVRCVATLYLLYHSDMLLSI